tara:strand:- start:173 stop:1360 length:1188 start_codon:yes stop_codon:yes gene_type:complete
MGIYRGPNTVKDGLIFGYDTGYGVNSNNVGTRFYPGEPTTNLYTNSDFSSGESGWTFGSWDGNISHEATTVQGPYGNTVSAVKFTVNSTSSYSHFHQYNNGKYTSGNSYTQSAWVKGYGTMWGKSHWGGNTQFTMTGDWQYITYTVNATTTSTGNFPYWGGEGLTAGTVFYMTDVQTEANSHATPYVKSGSTTGSRTDTTSLIDLKKTIDIDVSNVSFGTTGQPTFDGTNDYISKTRKQYVDEPWSVDIVFKPTDDTDTSWNGLFGGNIGAGGYWFFHSAGNLALYSSVGYLSYRSWTKANTFVAGEYHHLTITFKSTGVGLTGDFVLYYNGGEKTDSFSFTFANSYSLDSHWIGMGSGNRFGTNDVAIYKEYDKILTAAEVQQNYKAYKNRFNI